jgi:hypothetical protein
MEILKRYQTQYEEFCKIDDFNLESTSKRVPAEKHFWVCRLIDAKIERERLYKQKATMKHNLQQKLIKDSPVALNKQYMDEVDKSPSIESLNERIKEMDYVVEYLTRLVDNISYIAQDIKNIIEIKRLQEL